MRLASLFRRRTPPAFDAPLAPERPFAAVGDLHGRRDLLDRLIPRLGPRPWVFVGDYIDRGEDSAGVLRTLAEMQASDPGGIVCLAGNHEEMFLRMLDEPARHGPSWLRFGGLQTLASFGLAAPADRGADAWEDTAQALREALGRDLRDWLTGLPTLWQNGNVAVVHAGADPALPMTDQPGSVLTWGHPEFDDRDRQDGVWVVHGHTIVDAPQARRGRIPIDTGAFATNRLTAVRIAAGHADFVTT